MQELNLKIGQINKAKAQLETAKKFLLRLDRCENSVSSVALQGAMQESSRIMGEIVNCDLPLQFRESVTVRCDKI